ncbi:MAG: hypothetical protein ACJZ9G_12860 [Rhodospirillales bacterium]|tara:strand:+ start:1104 stop:1874 length:771 start_codon:yes stop_codon:yes gene_type:complete
MGRRSLCHGDGYINTFIIYGRITNPETVIKRLETDLSKHKECLTSNLAIVNLNTSGFRLNNRGWADFNNAGPINIESTSTMFEIVREKIKSKISPFSKNTNNFIRDYLDFIEVQVTKINISKTHNELFDQYDWIFSAWLPLTHAYILIDEPNDIKPMEFAEFDICYWTGRKLLCINLGNSNSIIKSKQRRIDFLKNNNPLVEIINIPTNIDLDKEKKFASHLFDIDFKEFWNGLKLPLGPNGPPILSKHFSEQNIK